MTPARSATRSPRSGFGFCGERTSTAARPTVSFQASKRRFNREIRPSSSSPAMVWRSGARTFSSQLICQSHAQGTRVSFVTRSMSLTTSFVASKPVASRVQARGVSIAVFVIDACRDNPLAAIGGRGIGAARGLARPEAPEGVLVIHSASPGEQALDRLSESDPNPNSVFTRELLPLLREKSLGHLAIAKRLQTAVRKVARTVGHQQFPDYIDRVAGEIVLHPALPVSASVQPEVTLPKYTSVPSEPRQAEERQASTDGSNSVAAVIPPSMESTLAAPDSKAPSAPGATSLFQRAILYEENPAQPQQPRASGGRAVWRLDNVNAGQGQSLETVVRATVEVPDAGMTLTMLI